MDRAYEIHHSSQWAGCIDDGDVAKYIAQLKEVKCPIYLMDPHPDFPEALPFPMRLASILTQQRVEDDPYLTNSIAFMLCAAILERPAWIGIYGVDMLTDSEWGHQRPNCEYLIGIARGMGIDVYVHERSALMKANFVYGRDPDFKTRPEGPVTEEQLMARIAHYEKEIHRIQVALNTFDGAKQADSYWLQMVRHWKRGGVVPPGPLA